MKRANSTGRRVSPAGIRIFRGNSPRSTRVAVSARGHDHKLEKAAEPDGIWRLKN